MLSEEENLKLQKAPRENNEVKSSEQLSLVEQLKKLEQEFQLEDYYDLASNNLEKLDLARSLFLVFCGWKIGRLNEFDPKRIERLFQLKNLEFKYFEDFLQIHKLRIEGELEKSFHLLESLQASCPQWIIKYRFAAESLNIYDFITSTKIMKLAIPNLPKEAQNLLQFNLGIAALNQGQNDIYSSIEKKLSEENSTLAIFLSFWLRGGEQQKLGQSRKAVNFYLEALNLIDKIPSRKTDRSTLAFLILQQSVWAGDLYASRKAWATLEKEIQSKNNLSQENLSLATALNEINEGKLSEALLRFESLFINTAWTKVHLRAGDYYLWILLAKNESSRGKKLIQILAELRRQLGITIEDYEHRVFELCFDHLAGSIDALDFQKKLLNLIDILKIRGLEQGRIMAEFFYGLVQEDNFEKAEAFILVKHNLLMQKIGVALLTRNHLIPSAFRLIREHLNDDLAKLMLDLQLSRLTEDLSLFVQTFQSFSKLKATAWLTLLEGKNSPLSLDFGRSLQKSELLIDSESRRVLCLETLESLDSQPLLTELAISLYRNPNGLNKEETSLGVGYSNYDPIQHDPIIYNLFSRLRDWLRKQGISVSIVSGRNGWGFFNRDRIASFHLEAKNIKVHSLAPTAVEKQNFVSPHYDMLPRLNWILLTLEKKGFICRSDLMNRFQIKKSTAATDFNALIEQNRICRHGSGRGIYYTLLETQL